MDPDIALDRLATQGMAPGITDLLRERFESNLTDVWFDNQTGAWTIAIAGRQTADEAETYLESLGLRHHSSIEQVGFDRRQLLDRLQRIVSGLKDLSERGVVAGGIRQAALEIDVSSDASASDLETVREVVRGDGAEEVVPVHITEHAPRDIVARPQVACSWPFCDTIVAGTEYSGPNLTPNQPDVPCSLAFYGRILLMGGGYTRMMLTADHCVEAMAAYQPVKTKNSTTSVWANIGVSYHGDFGTRHGDGGDWGYVVLDNPQPTSLNPGPYGGFINWTTNTTVPISSAYYTSSAPVNMYVCHQGRGISTTQCGTINRQEAFGQLNTASGTVTLHHMLEIINTIACPGDSGGPWATPGGAAVGMHSSVLSERSDACGYTAYASPLHLAAQRWPGNFTLPSG